MYLTIVTWRTISGESEDGHSSDDLIFQGDASVSTVSHRREIPKEVSDPLAVLKVAQNNPLHG